MNLAPDLILISPFKQGGYDAMKEVDIPLVPHLGYKETTPLGQAEWIKFVGLLIGEEEKANKIFNEIEQKYNDLKRLTARVEHRPVVLSGEIHGGTWYAVGGQSFLGTSVRRCRSRLFPERRSPFRRRISRFRNGIQSSRPGRLLAHPE